MNKLVEQKMMILQDFDFKKVERVMKSLEWEWIGEGGIKYTPTISDLTRVADMCLSNVIKSKEKEDTYSIGGFESIKMNGVLELRFIVEMNNSLSNIL
jgi:hypothetical protein